MHRTSKSVFIGVGAVLLAFIAYAQGSGGTESEQLESDIETLEARLKDVSAPAGPVGPAGPEGAPGAPGNAGPAGHTLNQAQVVALATRTEALEKRARGATLRLEQLKATLEALHSVTDKLEADADTLEQRTKP